MSSIFKRKLGLGKHKDKDKDKHGHGHVDDHAPLTADHELVSPASAGPVSPSPFHEGASTPSAVVPAVAPAPRALPPPAMVPTAIPSDPSPRDAAAALRASTPGDVVLKSTAQEVVPEFKAAREEVASARAPAPAKDLPEASTPSKRPPSLDESGDDFSLKQATLRLAEGHEIPDKLSALLDQGIEVLQHIFGVGGYTMAGEILRWSMLVQIFGAVLLTYLLASFHVYAVVTVPVMISVIWLIWAVHLKSVTTRIKTQTRLDFILSGMMPEKESAWWLNMVLRACWPVFLRDFLNRVVVPKLAPWFLNKYKPPVLVSVDVMGVDMGDVAPVVSNVRILQGVAGDSHIELEMDLEVASADNMFIQCGAKIVAMSAITWQAFVTGMHLTGTIRVGLKFTNAWTSGFVERVSIQFPHPPQLSCAIRVIGGLDAASMPLVASYVEATLQSALNAALVWPNRIMVVDAVKAVAHLLNISLPESSDHLEATASMSGGAKQVKLTRALAGKQAATAVVEILDGEDLVAADSGGTSDPYVKGVLGPGRFSTGVIQKTLNPFWVGEKYELPIVDWSTKESYTLHLKVRDHDTFSTDDELGFATVDLRQLRGGMPQELWLDLQDAESGTLHVRIAIQDDAGLTEEEREVLLEAKKQQEAANARKLAGLLGKIDPDTAEAAAGMLGSLQALDPKTVATQAGSFALRKYRKSAEALAEKHLLPKSLIGGDVAAMVEVEVVEGQNLLAADKGGTSDPYVRGILGRSKFTTQVIYKTLNPKWLEKHRLTLKQWPEPGQKCQVLFEVFDRDRSMKDDFLGRATVDLVPLKDGAKHEMLLQLQGTKTGSIRVIMQVIDLDVAAESAPEPSKPVFEPVGQSSKAVEAKKEEAEAKWGRSSTRASSAAPYAKMGSDYSHAGVLVANTTPGGISSGPMKEVYVGLAQPPPMSYVKVEILEAEGLEPKDLSGYSDPFVKGFLGAVQFSTKVVNKSLNPKWYDTFKLPVVEWHSDTTMLTLEVFDKNAMIANANIGRCMVNLNYFKDGNRHDLWLRLENAKSGKIHIAVTNLDDTMEIKSEIMEVIPGVVVESWKVRSEHLKPSKTIAR